MGDPTQRLTELDSRHDELLGRLNELDQQIHDILDEWAKAKQTMNLEMVTQLPQTVPMELLTR